jgi:hypothetical protein
VRRLIREGQAPAILSLVAVPIARLAENLRRLGQTVEADSVLTHAVHDGVAPRLLLQAIAQNATPPAIVLGDPTSVMTVDPATGAVTAGAPPAASDAESAATLANYLLERIGG